MKLITEEFEELFKNYPLYSQDDQSAFGVNTQCVRLKLENLVIQFAEENPSWDYGRIDCRSRLRRKLEYYHREAA